MAGGRHNEHWVMELDAKAVAMVQRYGNLPRCLWVPVAARDIAAITRYVGVVEQVLAGKAELRAIVVRPDVGAGPGSGCPLSAPVWRHPESAVFHAQRQVWVHVDYGGYLRAYRAAFADEDLTGYVVDHVQNRRESRLRGYTFVRLHHISKGVNSSSGRGVERLGADFYKTDSGQRLIAMQGDIRYAGVEDLTKMLGVKMGGGPLDGLEESLHLFEPGQHGPFRPCHCGDRGR